MVTDVQTPFLGTPLVPLKVRLTEGTRGQGGGGEWRSRVQA